jgi:XTP/dITP diphosphohydrolase
MTRKFSGDTLVLATHNRKKVGEFQALFGEKIQYLKTAADFGLESPAETGTTFIENAMIKALYTAKATGLPSLSDDSGFCVAALQGAPGVYSADWAEQPDGSRDFGSAMVRVHREVGPAADKGAHFTSVFVLAWPDGHAESAEGHVYGTLIWPPRGEKGFGYDPMFIPKGETRTFAEMQPEEKNAVSHRAQAFSGMMKKCFNEKKKQQALKNWRSISTGPFANRSVLTVISTVTCARRSSTGIG